MYSVIINITNKTFCHKMVEIKWCKVTLNFCTDLAELSEQSLMESDVYNDTCIFMIRFLWCHLTVQPESFRIIISTSESEPGSGSHTIHLEFLNDFTNKYKVTGWWCKSFSSPVKVTNNNAQTSVFIFSLLFNIFSPVAAAETDSSMLWWWSTDRGLCQSHGLHHQPLLSQLQQQNTILLCHR